MPDTATPAIVIGIVGNGLVNASRNATQPAQRTANTTDAIGQSAVVIDK